MMATAGPNVQCTYRGTSQLYLLCSEECSSDLVVHNILYTMLFTVNTVKFGSTLSEPLDTKSTLLAAALNLCLLNS